MKPGWLGLASLAVLIWSNPVGATTQVCVSVQQRSWYRSPPHVAVSTAPDGDRPPGPAVPAPPPAPASPTPPARESARQRPAHTRPLTSARFDPTLYLKRMLEYEVTHENGFVAVAQEPASSSLVVELYQLESGWTVFGHYGEREEKVDRAELDEFGELAQRLAFALLRGRSVGQTITRENVLRSDSERDLRTVEGTGHFIFGMGTEVRLAQLPTAQGQSLPATDQLRVLTPVSVEAGYRRKLHAWGFDAFGRVDLGTEQTGIHDNDSGRSCRLFVQPVGWPALPALPRRAGHQLALLRRRGRVRVGVLRRHPPAGRADRHHRSGPPGRRRPQRRLPGGLRVLAGELDPLLRPARAGCAGLSLETENSSGSIDTYMPGAVAQIGIIFSHARGAVGASPDLGGDPGPGVGDRAGVASSGRARAQLRTCVEVAAAPARDRRADAPGSGARSIGPHPPRGHARLRVDAHRRGDRSRAPPAASGSPAGSARRSRTGSGSAATASCRRSSGSSPWSFTTIRWCCRARIAELARQTGAGHRAPQHHPLWARGVRADGARGRRTVHLAGVALRCCARSTRWRSACGWRALSIRAARRPHCIWPPNSMPRSRSPFNSGRWRR